MNEGLTEEQSAVAGAGVAERLLVTAGPGTGKTHTLVARISHLVEEDDVHPGGILALSFSRAAVGELKDRLRATGRDAGRVAPITFDSFATRLLSHVDPDGPWAEETFDGRIQAACDQMDAIGDFLEDIEHVCVDELQDLVGVRMHFVSALLRRLGVGFTLLGDPAQGIYDFALDDDEDPEAHGSPAFYRWVRESFDDLVEPRLTVNHRAKTELVRRAAALNQNVVEVPESGSGALLDILEEVPRLPSIGTLRNHVGDGRCAVLCRNNGEALMVSRELRENRIPHTLQRGATNRSVAPWVAGVIAATGGGIVNKKRFEDALQTLAGERPEIDDVWGALRRVARDDSGGVDLSRLSERMRQGVVPDELHAAHRSSIVVSTVHRAKGLEFERVVLVDDGWGRPCDSEAARTLYVAMTRTIEHLVTVDLPMAEGRLEVSRRSGRWIHTGWKYWQRRGIELRPDDIDDRQPAGGGIVEGEVGDIQRRLADQVPVGADVCLRFLRARVGDPGAFYVVELDGKPIGQTTERFGEDLHSVLRASKKWTYPQLISGLSVDAVRSVAGDPLVGEQSGLGPGGVWLSLSLVGMGRFE